jgi:Tfp pilus assembly protein PilV
MNKNSGYSLIECLVAVLCIACILPAALSLLLYTVRMENTNIANLIIANELINYKSIINIKSATNLFTIWQDSLVAYNDLRISIVGSNDVCLHIKNSDSWCISGG